ncbi:MAG: GTP-binding protein, partial [Bacteroidales bacterium]|nr:GTP-binding protein [Bacteroidales bacterium]
MKIYNTQDIRNIALLGGAKSGKTTLAEAMAFEGKAITRMGSVDDKNTASDYRDIETEKQISVTASLLYAEFNDRKINILDTPGTPDFIGEPIGALHAVEAGVVLVNATSGIEVGTEIIWRRAAKLETPILFAVNQLDHEKANFEDTIRQLKESFGKKVTVVQYPVATGAQFDAVV